MSMCVVTVYLLTGGGILLLRLLREVVVAHALLDLWFVRVELVDEFGAVDVEEDAPLVVRPAGGTIRR